MAHSQLNSTAQSRNQYTMTRPGHGFEGRLANQLVILFLLVFSLFLPTTSAIGYKLIKSKPDDDKKAPWQNCDVFMSPTNTSTGWGVFANRDFNEGELIDITPLHFYLKKDDPALPLEHRLVKSTSLDDYVYGANYKHLNKYETNVFFGYEMVFNHHPTAANVQLALSHGGYVHGCYTKRSIRAGEEILSRYSSGDGGNSWFQTRGIDMVVRDTAALESPEQMDYLSSKYCTKIYAGAGPKTFQRLFPRIDPSRVAPFDAGLNDARAKVPIKAGEMIEQAPAMLLYKPFVKDTALAPMVITWDDMLSEHQDAMISASATMGGKLPIQYSGPGSQWQRTRRMTNLVNVAILPFAGRIGMVKRVDTRSSYGSAKSNCRLDITITVHDEDPNENPEVSVVLDLIATEDISTGQVLLLDLKPTGTDYERELLKAKLQDIGHPFDLDIDDGAETVMRGRRSVEVTP